VEQAYVEIKQRIVRGAWKPGTSLSESAISRALRTSRTPVREALIRLVEEGYVERIPARGFFVARVTMTLIQDLVAVRRLLEGAAAERAAQRASAEDVVHLRELVSYEYPMGDEPALRRAIEENNRFHLAVAQASGNAIFVEMVRHCLDQVTRLIGLGLEVDPMHAGTAEHQAVVEAIARRDPEAARAAIERHLDGSSQRMMQQLVRGEVSEVTLSAP